LNESTLSAIAQAAGGEYYRVGTTGNALVDALQNLQGAASDTRFETLAAERFQLFVLLALLMLFSAELIPARKPGWRSADWKRA